MVSNSRTSRLPPPVAPASQQLENLDSRVDGMDRLGRSPMIPPLGPKPSGTLPHILLVDDEDLFINASRAIWENTALSEYAYLHFFHFQDANRDELVEHIRSSNYDAIYIDLNLKGAGSWGGIGLIEELRGEIPELRYVPFVAITSYPDPELERQARERGAIRFMVKTIDSDNGGRFGTFVYRMITEARETIEQARDYLWADAASRLVEKLCSSSWESACADVIGFIHKNFTVKALYARRVEGENILVRVAWQDGFSVNYERIDVGGLSFIRNFLESAAVVPYQIFESIKSVEIDTPFTDEIRDHHVALARIGVGRETYGLLTMFRGPGESPFRRRDAEGLHRLAAILGTAILEDRLKEQRSQERDRLQKRQQTLLQHIRGIDSATEEDAIWERVRDALYASFAHDLPNAHRILKVTVRRIQRGSNQVVRACAPKGFATRHGGEAISLEHHQTSSIARAIWRAQSEIHAELDAARDGDWFIFRDREIKSALTVPVSFQGVCYGAVNFECKLSNAFSQGDCNFVEVLAETAAAAISRLKASRLLEGMIDVTRMLAAPDDLDASVLIGRIITLLFDFTGCSEILYVVPAEGGDADAPWSLRSIYQRVDGLVRELEGESARQWRHHMTGEWPSSFLAKALTSGNPVIWSQEEGEISVMDEGLPGRQRGQKTRTHAVIVVRNDDYAAEAMIGILIAHRHAMSDTRADFLARLGAFLASLLGQAREIHHILGAKQIHEQEARLGQVFGQLRHGLRSRLALIRQYLVAAEGGYANWPEAAAAIKGILSEVDLDIDRQRSMIKLPAKSLVDLGEVWSSIFADLAAVAMNHQGTIQAECLHGHTVVTDTDILRTILFNLVDNALRHGGPGTTVSAKARRVAENLVISVRDTGAGIADSVQDKLFEAAATTSPDSTGLGLYLSRLRAIDLGGQLKLAHSGGRGANFELSLPLS